MNALTLDVEQLADIPQAQFLLATQSRKNAQFAKLCAQALQDFELFDWCERQGIEPSYSFDAKVIQICFSGDGPNLAELWTILRRSGWNTTSRPKHGDTSYYGWWKKSDQCATISLSFTSSVCRRVQTGTRTVTKEEPIFETVCGEQISIEQADQVPAPYEPPTSVSGPSDDDVPF